MKVADSLAYVAEPRIISGLRGIKVLNITNPRAPAAAGEYEMPCAPQSIQLSGQYAYVLCQPPTSPSEVWVFDRATPTRLRLLAIYALDDTSDPYGGGAQVMQVDAGLIYVVNGQESVDILRLTTLSEQPAKPALVGVSLRASPAIQVRRGEILAVTLTATNRGAGAAKSALIEVPFDPARVQVLEAQTSRKETWVSALYDDKIEIQTGPLDNGGDTVSIMLRLRIRDDAPEGLALPGRTSVRWSDEVAGGSSSANLLLVSVTGQSQDAAALPLTTDPVSAAPGVPRAIHGEALAPGEPTALWYHTPDGKVVALSRVSADPQGNITYSLATEGFASGHYLLVAQGIWSGVTLAGDFEVR